MWKLLAKKHPGSITEQFPLHFNEAINNSNGEKFIILYYKTSVGKKSLLYQGYKIWNLEILANIKNKESYNNFAKNYPKCLLDEIYIVNMKFSLPSNFQFLFLFCFCFCFVFLSLIYSCNCYFFSNLDFVALT